MTTPPIPDDIRRFIFSSIPSVPYMEALLLLRSDVTQDWHAERLARALYVNETTAAGLLQAMEAGSVIAASSKPGMFRYEPGTLEMRQLIDTLAEIYAIRLVEVTNLIHARSNSKASRFADAFIWRKD